MDTIEPARRMNLVAVPSGLLCGALMDLWPGIALSIALTTAFALFLSAMYLRGVDQARKHDPLQFVVHDARMPPHWRARFHAVQAGSGALLAAVYFGVTYAVRSLIT